VVGQGGWCTAWLAVVAGNTRARRFYAKLGWRDQGPFIYLAQAGTGTVPVPATATSARSATGEHPVRLSQADRDPWRCSASGPQPESP
jgi:hypothetical protein